MNQNQPFARIEKTGHFYTALLVLVLANPVCFSVCTVRLSADMQYASMSKCMHCIIS